MSKEVTQMECTVKGIIVGAVVGTVVGGIPGAIAGGVMGGTAGANMCKDGENKKICKKGKCKV